MRRLPNHRAAALMLISGSITLGMTGYMCLEGLPAIDAFLESVMLLGGTGALRAPVTEAGKLFAGFFALYNRY